MFTTRRRYRPVVPGLSEYNDLRRVRATVRRAKVARLYGEGLRRSAIAARLEVSDRTIYRDIATLLQPDRRHPGGRCPTCLRAYDPSLPPGMYP
jgi:hypothetical protein